LESSNRRRVPAGPAGGDAPGTRGPWTAAPATPHDRAKRALDLGFALLALGLLAPLFLVVAVGIRVDSTGPVIFRQRRVGKCGIPFIFFKFRSMEVGAEEARKALSGFNEAEPPLFKIRDDPRVTRFGRCLRKCAIDELPQLVNVLRGEMSFVGPRPHLPEEAREYTLEQARRLSVTPGITCLYQVSRPSRIGFADWIAKDLEYVDRRSLALDLSIVLRTIKVVLTSDGMC
jgi:lipopolysaccharide/colanic/teichoic acid biosynthesis glycosyltransferase